MNNVLILTEGGKNIGFGHITRCIALADAFKYRKPEIKIQLVINGDKHVKCFLRSGNINFRHLNWLKNIDKILKFITKDTVVIIDSYRAAEICYKKIHHFKKRPFVVALDDYNRIEYDADVVLNPSIYGHDIDCQIRENAFYLTGEDYIILRKEFWGVSKKTIRKEVKNVLVTSGGINHPGFISKTIDPLKTKFDFEVHIVDPSKNTINAGEMLNLMLKTDICISGGGQTINELARVGVPTIGICFYENQRLNLEAWHKEGFINYAGWYNDDGLLNKIEHVIKGLLPHRERIKRSKIGRDKVDGKGGMRIADKMMEFLT